VVVTASHMGGSQAAKPVTPPNPKESSMGAASGPLNCDRRKNSSFQRYLPEADVAEGERFGNRLEGRLRDCDADHGITAPEAARPSSSRGPAGRLVDQRLPWLP
jgi:hypothetical protein